ncbi:neutral zinc metallopeptidase [Janibacter sp. GXQ6167]|uniref:KPN_02809 family neutral zinc metallopeptidase n=1 Tax=Janibacter sp. GXQ6167 TaxID=3240791 RepID=UPI00352626BC
MSFNDNANLDTSRVGGGGGGRGPVVAGGGILGLVVLVVAMLLGVNPNDVLGDQGQGSGQQSDNSSLEQCKTGSDANANRDCRMVATENSLYDFWSNEPGVASDLGQSGRSFEPPAEVVIYHGTAQSRCGTASNQVGPFYCPLDRKIFIDTDFFDLMQKQLGAEDGALAEEYVLAHEYGHHIQNLYGILGESQKDPKGRTSGAVRVELMADCFAGMWVQHATTTKDKSGQPLMKPITEEDVKKALSAARAVGDDTIQQRSGGGVNPDGWTHGSAQARQQWFLTGMKADGINSCDTFAVQDPENP